MKTYPTYDATGIKWNPTKPSHWEQWRGKRFFYSQKVKNIGNEEKNILSLTLKGVIRNSADRPIGLSPSDYSTYQIFEKDDLVFKLIDLNNISTSRVGLVPERGIMSSAYIRLTARHECNIRYFFIQYYDLWLRNIYNGLGAGVRQTLSVDDLLALDVVIPPREEQDQIVRFLDWKVSEINRLINIKRKEIARLEELKKDIISRVVTKGLDSSVPNLNKFPLNLDTALQEYYAKIAERVEQHPAYLGGDSERYYIQKVKPFFVNGKEYHEVTFTPATDKISKSNRVIAFTQLPITSFYAS